MQKIADAMANADSKKYRGLECNYTISMKRGSFSYYCFLCKVENKIGDFNKHLQPLSLHCETGLHLLNVEKSTGKKSENSIAKGIFEKAEAIHGKGLLALKDSGSVL